MKALVAAGDLYTFTATSPYDAPTYSSQAFFEIDRLSDCSDRSRSTIMLGSKIHPFIDHQKYPAQIKDIGGEKRLAYAQVASLKPSA